MKKTNLNTLLYSAVGVAAMLLILIAFNFIAGFAKTRIDLTAEKAYTLSPGTRAVLERLDTPIHLRLYVTQSDNAMPAGLRTYAKRIEDLLGEYRQLARGNIIIEKLDPKPDSEAEDSARLDGIEGQPVSPAGDRVYLGLSATLLDEKVAVPFFHPSRERLLEYDITRSIAQVMTPDKPVVGVMSALDAFGQPMNPMMRMQQQPPQRAWVLIDELKRDFEVRKIEMFEEAIDGDVQVLVVIHPREISPSAQFAIDQFVLRGGKLIAFLDPLCVLDPRGGNPMMGQPASSSSMERLLDAWGIEFDPSKVVADMNFGSQTRQGFSPLVVSLNPDAIDRDDVVTSQIDNLLMAFAGAFTGAPAEGLKKTALIQSSDNAQLVEAFMAQLSAEQIVKEFKPSGNRYDMAIRLEGSFTTAFPEGRPSSGAEDEDREPPGAGDHLRKSVRDGVVVLIGDADMVHDQASVEEMPNPFGARFIVPRNGNLTLAQGMVDLLGGDESLISIRSRATMNRPFTVVNKMRAEAEARYRDKIQELEQELAETQRRLNELQQTRDSGQRFILSPEQQAELERFRQREADVRRSLTEERRNLRQDIESLEFRTKVVNIAAMPLLVAFSGIALAMVKRKRTAAK